MVFCKDCKWYNKWRAWECHVVTGYAGDFVQRGRKQITPGVTYEENKTGDCTDYRRKWWKVWRTYDATNHNNVTNSR